MQLIPQCLVAALLISTTACVEAHEDEPEPAAQDLAALRSPLGPVRTLPNDLPLLNGGGFGATHSAAGDIDLTGPFNTAQGTNGRSCGSCHLPSAGWSITPWQIEAKFAWTEGTDPIFNPLDANNPAADVSTLEARRSAYSMLRKGLFRRGGTVPAVREYEVIAADDPHGYGSVSRFSVFRRALATANLHLAKNVGWDDGNTVAGDMHAGLFNQAKGNITGGQQGAAPTVETVEAIVGFEQAMSFAQVAVFGTWRLDNCGARGGPVNLSQQTLVNGRFNLYDAWSAADPCGDRRPSKARASIARGQELFNAKPSATGRTCGGCHDAENNGSRVDGRLFDIGASGATWRTSDLPLYTVQNTTTLETIQTTDPGRAARSGKWADMNRFKVPSLRGLAARAPYFHNGIAKTVLDVVKFYEVSLGWSFSDAEEDDLVAFLNAL